MIQKPLKIQEIVIKEEKNPQYFCESFIYQPSNYEEEKLGTLFLTGEVSNFHQDARYLLNYLASLLRREYYAGLRNEPLQALEAALKKANLIIEQIKQREGIDLEGKIRFLTAAVINQQLYVSQMGKIYALLSRSNQIFDLSRKILQLTDRSPANFSHTLQGKLYLGDRIVFATENLFKLCPLREFNQLLETKDLEDVNRGLSIILNGPQRLNLATIIIESMVGLQAPKQKIVPKKKKPGALTLEEIFGGKKSEAAQVSKVTLFEEAPLDGKDSGNMLERKIGSHLPASAGKITLIAEKISGHLPRWKFPRLNGRFSIVGHLIKKSHAMPSSGYLKRKTPLKNVYLAISIIFLIALAAAISVRNDFRRNDPARMANIGDPASLISEAKKKMEAADNALIMGDKNGAVKNLAAAQSAVKIVLQSGMSGGKGSDEATGLATKIKLKIMKILAPAGKNKK